MAELTLQRAQLSNTSAAAPAILPNPRARSGAEAARPVGNQARLRRLSPAPVQVERKLEVGAADDPLEQEADAAAEAVIRMSSSAMAPAEPPGSPEEAGASPAIGRLSRSAVSNTGGALVAPPIVHDALAAPGRPFEAAAREPMEAAFGADFRAVRVHTDALADRSARAIGARAYTLGADIVFARGQYQPGSTIGQRLRAHELAHSVQQAGGSLVRRSITTPSASDAAEVAGYLNSFSNGSAAASGASVVPAAGACTTNTGPGCECVCTAMQDTTRTYNISPVSCDVKLTKETMADGSAQTIPESSIWPTTSGAGCAAAVRINIPKAGSTMEFGAFDAASKPNWYPTWRILAHELCGHGVLCQTSAGGTGDRQQHDTTIDTENLIAAPPTRGHYKDTPRQGESFANKAGGRSKVAFVLKDGWHFEAP